MGAAEDSEQTNVHTVDLSCEIGYESKIRLKAPVILPAMAKLNWQDYYSGAAIAGGIAMEDTMFKTLALGAPNIKMVGVGRAAMAAAISGKNTGELIEKGTTPNSYKSFGEEADTIFRDAKYIKSIYNNTDKPISYGAIGLFSYLSRLTFGVKLLMTLNRKFSLKFINQSDVIPLTKEAKDYLAP